MAVSIDKEKEKLNTVNYTPLKNEFFVGGEAVFEQGVEHTSSPELSEYVESTPSVIPISSDLQALGVSSIDSTRFRSFETVTLPLTEEKINEGLKKPVWSSFRWLAEFTKAVFLKKVKTT